VFAAKISEKRKKREKRKNAKNAKIGCLRIITAKSSYAIYHKNQNSAGPKYEKAKADYRVHKKK
jgi:membrane-bound lytic murein transglycosylase MltF